MTISTKQTTWVPARAMFVTEASRLPGVGFPAAIHVASERTGRVKFFTEAGVTRDGEGDLLFVDYRCENLTLRIFND